MEMTHDKTAARAAVEKQLLEAKLPRLLTQPESADGLIEFAYVVIRNSDRDIWNELNTSLVPLMQACGKIGKLYHGPDIPDEVKELVPDFIKITS